MNRNRCESTSRRPERVAHDESWSAKGRAAGERTHISMRLNMPISVDEIAVDKSYVTATGQLRRVLKVDNGTVTYEEARGKAVSGNWGLWTTVGDGKFAQDVDRKVR